MMSNTDETAPVVRERVARTYKMNQAQVHSDMKDTGDVILEIEETLGRISKCRPELAAQLQSIRDKNQAIRAELIAIGARYHVAAARGVSDDVLPLFAFGPHATH